MQLQRRLPVPAGRVPDVVAAKALKSGAKAGSGFAVAVNATAVPRGRPASHLKQLRLQGVPGNPANFLLD